MAPLERDIMFHVRMSEYERSMLETLAEEEGVSASDFVRMSIRKAFAMRSVPKKPRAKR
jgi:hypothetical protein